VLLVDDDESIRLVVEALLATEGYRVHAFSNGEEALAALDAGLRPWVALMDLRMPVMDGWTTIARMHRCARHRSIPIVVFTDAGDRSVTPVRNAVAGYLPKPLCPDTLLSTLRRVLASPSREVGSATGHAGERR
jgi:two-component system, chemotaxis family, chemotaxis protein CheY